jgi:polyisoprenoid-binding protein YceI
VFIIKEAVNQSINEYLIKGDMTIKGVTKPIAFLAEVGNHILKAELTLNRTEFGIKYGSGSFFDNLGDNVIKDEFDLQMELIF